MKRPTFLTGVVVAVALSVLALAIGSIALVFLTGPLAIRLTVSVLTGTYVVYLLRSSGQHIGRVTTLAVIAVAVVAALLLDLSFPLYLAVHALLIWMARSLYFHSGVLPPLADMILIAVGAAGGYAAFARTGSATFAVWSFFLVQALFAAIPQRTMVGRRCSGDGNEERFAAARRHAEMAIEKILATGGERR